MRQSSLFFPLLLITVGAVWFLKTTDILPATSTLIAIGLAVVGIIVMVFDGINKQSIVQGPLLMYVGAAVYLIEHENAARSPLFAAGMIFAGCLMLIARSHAISPKYPKKK